MFASVLLAEGAEEFALVQDFAIIMAVAGAAVVLFRKLNQPPILGYLLAGLIISPFTFELVAGFLDLPNSPITHIESIRLLADLGLVLLLFALGLEFGWSRIRQVGVGVLLIGTIEIMVMISLGFWIGRLLGWSTQEAIFLGAALCISSSAILVKVLRDSNRLTSNMGRIIVGILVVEDFAAVILLTLLSGIATTGTASLGQVGFLVLKLSIFAVASLALGGLFVPRIIRYVNRFGSRETLLLASLALCFALALLGQSLGISAAAGAFLIGAVIGDTTESHQINEMLEPIRDMFAALFFVSIGMLIDLRLIVEHIVPAVVVSLVFMTGKVLANTVGTFLAGQGGRVPVQVGMGMPQIGEFSLAMMKIGAEHEAVRAFLYQVIVGVTALTSLVYPYVARSTDRVASLLEQRSPRLLRRSVVNFSGALQACRRGLAFDTEFAHRMRRAALPVGINLLIIIVLVGVGTFVVGLAPRLSQLLNLPQHLAGTIIGAGILLLCAPSTVALWRSLRHLAEEASSQLALQGRILQPRAQERLRRVLREALAASVLVIIALWSLPLVLELLSLGALAAPLPLAVLAVLGLLAVRMLTQMQRQLVISFSQTFVGSPTREETHQPESLAADPPAAGHSPEAAGPGGTDADADRPDTRPGLTRGEADWIDLAAAQHSYHPQTTPDQVTLGEAELAALAEAQRDPTPYRGRVDARHLAWEVKESVESNGNFRIVLSVKSADAAQGPPGEEELYLDPTGRVRSRQVLRWPAGRTKSPWRNQLLWYTLAVVVGSVAGGVAVFALLILA